MVRWTSLGSGQTFIVYYSRASAEEGREGKHHRTIFFRIRGYGLAFVLDGPGPNFSERMGLRRTLRLGNLTIEVLKPKPCGHTNELPTRAAVPWAQHRRDVD